MKWFSYIFSIYFLVLACIPCSDAEHSHAVSENHTIISEHSEGQHEHCADFCTPFCTCACCGSVFSLPKTAIYSFISQYIPPFFEEKSLFFFSNQFISNYLANILQPPQ
jgi:hypothetical protein